MYRLHPALPAYLAAPWKIAACNGFEGRCAIIACVTRTKSTWLSLAVLYVLFFGWYTSFGGPLSDEEVEHFMALIERNAEDPDPAFFAIMREFLESDTGDDFVMWNVIDLHETPLQVEGVEPGGTSQQVVMKYMEYMLPALLKRACHPVIMGTAAGRSPEMFGLEGVREWDQGAGMRYRSRRDMLEIATNPAFRGAHRFKIAGLRKSFAFPIDPWFQLGDPRLVIALLFLVIGLGVGWLGARWSA